MGALKCGTCVCSDEEQNIWDSTACMKVPTSVDDAKGGA